VKLDEMDDPGGNRRNARTSPLPDMELPPPDQALVRRSSAQQVALHLRKLIFDGRLRQGDRVPQDAIARTLGVSRIPVREALLSLEREGWVTIRPHRGAFIGALDEAAVRDHYALYGLVFGFTAKRAVERGATRQADRLAVLCDRLDEQDDPEVVARLNREINRLIVDTANSSRLRAMLRAMVGIVPGNFFALIPGAIETEQAGSRSLLEAVRAGDADAAADSYARKLGRQGDLVADLFAGRGLFAHPGHIGDQIAVHF
jgi:DNA-binding GntR family transcriptional regulator